MNAGIDASFIKNNIGDSLSLLKANVHQFKSECNNMHLVSGTNNLRIFHTQGSQATGKMVNQVKKQFAKSIALHFSQDSNFGKFYFFVTISILLSLSFMGKLESQKIEVLAFYVSLEYLSLKSFAIVRKFIFF